MHTNKSKTAESKPISENASPSAGAKYNPAFVDNRPEATQLRKFQEAAHDQAAKSPLPLFDNKHEAAQMSRLRQLAKNAPLLWLQQLLPGRNDGNTIQRRPVEAFAYLKMFKHAGTKELDELISRIKNTIEVFAFGSSGIHGSAKRIQTQSYWEIIDLLAEAIRRCCRRDGVKGIETNMEIEGETVSESEDETAGIINEKKQKEIVRKLTKRWNNGIGTEGRITQEDLLNRLTSLASDDMDEEEDQEIDRTTDEQLAGWYDKAVSEKSMTAERKQRELRERLFKDEDHGGANSLSVDERLAVETMFVHTAVSNPKGNQGKELLGSGNYFRSGSHGVKNVLSDTAKGDDENLAGKVVNPFNKAMHDLLKNQGILKGKLAEATFVESSKGKDGVSIAAYEREKHSRVSGLGLMSNAIRTMRTLISLFGGNDPRKGKGKEEMDEDLGDHSSLLGIVPPDMLVPTTYRESETNYHDKMLQDRGQVVREIGAWVNANFDGITAVQSPEHASLILAIGDGHGAKDKYLWMNLFIEHFNARSEEQGTELKLTHRNSFGFLYPTASELGGPVRIWPGAAPASVLRNVLAGTIDDIASKQILTYKARKPFANPVRKKAVKKKRGKREEAADALNTNKEGILDQPLHMDTLRMAVNFAHLTLQRNVKTDANKILYKWILERLTINLHRARYLLSLVVSSEKINWEHHFLKSAGIIENLMEYSYMLLAVSEEKSTKEPYWNHVKNNLPMRKGQQHRLYHLDSGMQAITLAGIIAQEYIRSVAPEKKKSVMTMAKPYFEVPGINRFKLGMKVAKEGEHPDLIVTDLNPVFTSKKDGDEEPSGKLNKMLADNLDRSALVIPIMDITNSTLAKVGDLMSRYPYPNYIVAESLSKHEHLGTDKFNAGRLLVVGNKDLIKISEKMGRPVANAAGDSLLNQYRRQIDKVYYGGAAARKDAPEFIDTCGIYTQFMHLMGKGGAWDSLMLQHQDKSKTLAEVSRQLRALLEEGFTLYRTEVSKPKKTKLPVEQAFRSLPSADQNSLLRSLYTSRDEDGMERDSESTLAAHGIGFFPQTGIENLGQTCYLAATLNTLAVSGYYDLFTPGQGDGKAVLRADVKRVLDKIRAEQLVTRQEVALLFYKLNQANLLEARAHGARRASLNDQRDPAEVLEYLLDFFKRDGDRDFQFSQTHNTRLTTFARERGVAGNYSELNKQDELPPETKSHWILKLPIAEASNLRAAMQKYLQDESVPDVKASQKGKVVKGTAVRSTALGAEAPKTITVQLIRWKPTGDKDDKEVNMPQKYMFWSGNNYTLVSVVYHLGNRADQGHYTTSTRGSDGKWYYRDDASVFPDREKFNNRRKLGYIYTYNRVQQPDNVPTNATPHSAKRRRGDDNDIGRSTGKRQKEKDASLR